MKYPDAGANRHQGLTYHVTEVGAAFSAFEQNYREHPWHFSLPPRTYPFSVVAEVDRD